MKLLIGIGATLLIGASTYAFCPPKQNSVTTVTSANGVCVTTPTGTLNLAVPSRLVGTSSVSTLALPTSTLTLTPSVSVCAAVAPCPPTPPSAAAGAMTPRRAGAAKMLQRQGTTRARVASGELIQERQALEKAHAELEAAMVKSHHDGDLADLDKRQAELNAVQARLQAHRGELRARAAEMGVEANKLRGAIEKQAVEHALKAERALDGNKIKLMTEHLRLAGDLVPTTEKAMLEAQRALEAAAAAQDVVVASDAASEKACQAACEAACTETCDAACADACTDACEAACEAAGTADTTVAGVIDELPTVDVAAGEWAVDENGDSVSTFSVDTSGSDDGVVVLENGETADAPSAFAVGAGNKVTVMGSGENGEPKVRVMRMRSGGGGVGGDNAPRARTIVRSGGMGGKLTRIAPGAYKISTSGSGNGAGEHAQILDQLKLLTEEVRALREEVRALRSGNRVNETY